jgi:hypothetical protein
MVPVAPIITGIACVFTFHMCCISIVRYLYFKIFTASFLMTFLSHYYYYHYYYHYHHHYHIIRSITRSVKRLHYILPPTQFMLLDPNRKPIAILSQSVQQ